jgi:hypothetical protein
MLMRYHWGLAVGHVYTHGDKPAVRTATCTSSEEGPCLNSHSEVMRTPHRNERPVVSAIEVFNEDASDTDQLELDLGNRSDDEWEDVEGPSDDCSEHGSEESSDDMANKQR